MKNLCLFLGFALVLFACDQNNQDTPEPTDFGYLSMNIILSIEEVPASGRIEAVSTDDWSVTIFNASDDSEVINFTPFVDAPAEVQLPTGEYYVEAHSNNFADAAFENPYYFGRSDNFTIDKEELKSIDVNAELANSKVKINYLPSVTSTFDRYSGTVMVVGSGESLFYNETETREGYFVSAPLAVEVNLSYDKLGGGTIDRTFTTEIDAQPKTLYNINVDATLEDGKVMINIDVNEEVETVEIELGDGDVGVPNFSKVFGGPERDYPRWMINTSDGGYLVGGTFFQDYTLIKLSKDGNEEWIYTSSSGGGQITFAGIELHSGDFMITGNDGQTFIAKFDPNGNQIFKKSIVYGQFNTLRSMTLDTDGNIVLAGRVINNYHGNMWISKSDEAGNILWNHQIPGNGGSEEIYSIISTSDEGYAVAGYSNSTDGVFSQNNGSIDAYLLKLDQSRNVQWSYNTGESSIDYAHKVIETQNGDFVVGGYVYAQFPDYKDNNNDAFVSKVASDGSILWERRYGNMGSDEICYDLHEKTDGNIVFAGRRPDYITYGHVFDVWLATISTQDGAIITDKSVGGTRNDFVGSILQTEDNGFIIAAHSDSPDGDVGENNGEYDIWIYKMNENFEF